jgi:hypothetical protein
VVMWKEVESQRGHACARMRCLVLDNRNRNRGYYLPSAAAAFLAAARPDRRPEGIVRCQFSSCRDGLMPCRCRFEQEMW